MGKIHDAPAMPDAKGVVRPADAATQQMGNVLGRVLALALVEAIRDPMFRAEARTVVAELYGAKPQKTSDLTAREAAAAIGVSSATFRRLALQPSYFAGDERAPRFDLDALRQQLKTRGPRTTTPPKKVSAAPVADDADVENVLTRAGLRAVGGGWR